MTDTPNDGGPEMPQTTQRCVKATKLGPIYETTHYPGLSLRDYFAAQAIQPLLSEAVVVMQKRSHSDEDGERTGFDDQRWPEDGSPTTWASCLADEAYMIADAMLAHRNSKGGE